MNIILQTDSYKLTQPRQYPSDMIYMHDYLESRGGIYGYTKFFGLQYYIQEYLMQKVTVEMVEEAVIFCKAHGIDLDIDGWMYIAKDLDGKLPLRIRAVKEGAIIPNHNVLMTIESTDERVPWIVTWAETLLLKVWYPITVGTYSYKIKQIIRGFAEKTSDNVESELPFKLHDFGYRGVSSEESAMLGGMAHLTNFKGTDTIAGAYGAMKYYHATTMPGFSIPASEHSTITSWTEKHEIDAYRNILEQYPTGIVSLVLDSYNFFRAIDTMICGELKPLIMNRDGLVVLRPDSGDAATNILYALRHCSKAFGYQVNSKGFKVLNNIRLIQGDGVSEDVIYDILKLMKKEKFSVDNIAFGCGGALLQGNKHSSINRDTHKFAIKCSAIQHADGTFTDVYKDPVTDRGKSSKRGRLDLVKKSGKFVTVNISKLPLGMYHPESLLHVVYENGNHITKYDWEEIRANDNIYNVDTEVTIEFPYFEVLE
ncbi:MAG: nicotinate phosphoribosyltransferase [Culicoidibacterales bacterium]